MNPIAQNPYRVLGMLANDSLKVMTANIARIRAYLKVGKKCEFDSDYTEIFGHVDRSEQSLERAIENLSSETDVDFYKYLWLNRTYSLPKSVNTITDILHSNNNSNDVANIINRFISALWTKNNYLIVSSLISLLEKEKSVSQSITSRLINFIVKDSGAISLQEFWENYKILSETLPITNNEVRTVICDVVNTVAIDKLRNDKLVRDLVIGCPNRENLIIINNWFKQLLCILKESSHKGIILEPNAEGQIAISEFSKILVEVCQRYYSENPFRLVSQSEEFVSILREIYKSAYDSTVKESCAEFGKKVKSQQKYLAPHSMQSQSLAIKKEIDSFCEKQDEVKWSLFLLRNCAPILLEIKNELGSENAYYLRISTKIADNAIYNGNIELSSAMRKLNNPANDKNEALNYLKHVIKNCGILIADIYQLDLESDFETQKATPFLKKVTALIEKYEIDDTNIRADISLETDFDKLEACGEDYDALIEYVLSNPGSTCLKEAIAKIWKIEDEDFPKSITVKALLSYKQKYPNSHNDKKILNHLDQLLLGPTLGSIFEYRQMLHLWPNHPKKAIIEGRIDLINFKNCCCIGDWEAYLKYYPNGQHRDEARIAIETEAFRQCNSLEDYKRFLVKYPTSKFHEEARVKAEEYIYLDAKKTGNYSAYLAQYPNGRYSATARLEIEEKDYQNAISKNDFTSYLKSYPRGRYVDVIKSAQDDFEFKKCSTIADFKRYLRIFPKGKHFGEAKRRVTNHRNKVIVVRGVVIAIVVILLYMAMPDTNTVEKTGAENKPTGTNLNSETQSDIDSYSEFIDNSLPTGSQPYQTYFGEPESGGHQISFHTASGCDYVIIVKRHNNDKYVTHVYIKGDDSTTINVPDGTFDVYFYSGIGWDPYLKYGEREGGFVESASIQKDGPITLQREYEGDYYYYQTLSYTLYPVYNGNLKLQGASEQDAF